MSADDRTDGGGGRAAPEPPRDTGDAQGPAGPGDAGGAGDAGEHVTRSRTDRYVAGVCGGLGRHFGVDPIVFRVVVAATTLMGGVGLLLYGMAWLVLPQDGDDRSAARRLMAGQVDHRSFAAAVLLVMGVAVFFAYVDDGFGRAVPLLAVSAIVLFLTWSENRGPRGRAGGAATANAVTGTTVPGSAGPAATGATAAEATAAGATGAGATGAGLTGTGSAGAGAAPPGGADPGDRGAAAASGWWKASGPPAGPGGGDGGGDRDGDGSPRRPRSYLTIGVVSLAVAVAGVLSVVAGTGGAGIPVQVVLAVVLAVLAAGLLVGTFFGRARPLLLSAVPVTAALVLVSAWPVPVEGPAGERRWAPVNAASVQEPFRMKAGELELDLRDLDLGPAGSTVRVVASIAAGNVTVTVPEDVHLVVRGRAGAGTVELPDGESGGVNVDSSVTLGPEQFPSRGTIVLDVRVGLGEVEVLRAP